MTTRNNAVTFRQEDHDLVASRGRFEKTGEFFKVEDGVAYGWAIVCTEKGKPYWDLQDDHIPEDEMVAAAIDFMKNSRVGSDQHTGEHVGDIVFGLPVTKASPSLGLASDKTGFLIGYQPQDPVHLDMIANGERTGFSIGGFLLEYEAGEIGKAVWSTTYQNDLPDSAFLYVKAGGSIDKSGRTTPRSLRMFPVKDATGKADGPHIDSALSRIPQAKLAEDVKTSLVEKAKGLKAAKQLELLAKGSPDPSDVYVPGDIADSKSKKKKPKGKVYRRFKIDEISLVTKPAQEGATVAYVKGATIAKADVERVFTSSEDGHQHVVCVDDLVPNSDYTLSTGCAITGATGSHLGEWHSHQIILNEDGSVSIADNAGHGHSVDVTIDPSQVDDVDVAEAPTGAPLDVAAPATLRMSAPAQMLTAKDASRSVCSMTEQEIAKLKSDKDRAERMADLNDAQRAYVKTLSTSDADDFIAKSASDRAAIAKAAIEYTADDGTVYYKGEDARYIAQVKRNDDLSKKLVTSEALAKSAFISKAATEDMSHYPEDNKVHEAVMAAIELIPEEATRKAARVLIKAGDLAIAKVSKMGGTRAMQKSGDDIAADPIAKAEGALKTAVEAYQKAKNLSSYEEAFAAATAVDGATRAAYDQLNDARRGRGEFAPTENN